MAAERPSFGISGAPKTALAFAWWIKDFNLAMLDELPPRWTGSNLRPTVSKVPLVFIWPGRIPAGQRFVEPVSMLDVLPTVLDLLEWPAPEIVQGRSLATALLGLAPEEAHPVFFEQIRVLREPAGMLDGHIEVVDGRWGASLWFNEDRATSEEAGNWRRPTPMLLFDLWNDPMALVPVNEKHPKLADKYYRLLREKIDADLALGKELSRGQGAPLEVEQLEALRALGYIQ